MAVFRVDVEVDDPQLVFAWIEEHVPKAFVVRTVAYGVEEGWYMKNVFKRQGDAELFHSEWFPYAQDHSVASFGERSESRWIEDITFKEEVASKAPVRKVTKADDVEGFSLDIESREPFLCRFISGEERFVHTHLPGLFKEWSEGKTPFTEFNVNNNNCEEMAVYLGVAWSFIQNSEVYGIPCYYRDDAGRLLRQECDLVDWEYDVITEEPDCAQGFVRGRSVGSQHQGKAGLFRIQSFGDLVKLQKATLGDASSEITLFAVGTGRIHELLALLRGTSRPDIDTFLAAGELLVDVAIGIDMGYLDCLTIRAAADFSEQVNSVEKRFKAAIESYEKVALRLCSKEEALSALEKLAAGELQSSIA